MKIRFCKDEDERQIRDLWEYCFTDTQEEVDFYYKYKFVPKNTISIEKDGKLISAIHLNQHKINLRDKVFDATYVVGVSTLPEARGIGGMKELMKSSLKSIYDRGQAVSILMPIDFRLYRPFGFVNCYDIEVQKIEIWELKSFKINGEFKKGDKPHELKRIYDASTERFNGYALRDEKYFREFIEDINCDGGHVYTYYSEGVPRGYLAYKINGDTIVVRELYYNNIESYKSMLGFIFNHNTQCKYAEIYTYERNPLSELMDNPKNASFERKPFMMGRIINFEKFMDSIELPLNLGVEGTKIKIKDEFIEENNGLFEFVKKGEKTSVMKIDSDEIVDEFKIGELTEIAFHYRTVEEIEFLYDKTFKKRENLKKIFEYNKVKHCNHINEYV